MKGIFTTSIISICLIALSFSNQNALANGSKNKITISGNVYGKDNNKLHPIEIVVRYQDNKESPKTFHTLADGSYKIELRKSSGADATIITLLYSCTGYKDTYVRGLNGAENQVINKMMYSEGDKSFASLSDAYTAVSLKLSYAIEDKEPKEKIMALQAKLFKYSPFLIVDKDQKAEVIAQLVAKKRIIAMQGYLADTGFYRGKVDGVLGWQTFNAMTQWNTEYGPPYVVDANGLVQLEAKAHAWEMKKIK